MAAITAELVKRLRETTGLPMMECKQALSECDGDFEHAKEWLRKKHKGKLEDRADRETGEGRIGVFIDPAGKVGGIVELRCETAPVAKNEIFINLANAFARRAAEGGHKLPDPAALRQDPEMDRLFVDAYGKLRETMNLVQCRRVAGEALFSYVHHDGKTGVMLALSARPGSAAIGADLCMHAAFMQPLAIDRAGIPAEQAEKARTEAREIARAEGKPENLVEKIAEGRVNAFFAQKVLVEQEHARSDVYGKKKVREILAEAGVPAVTEMVLMRVGA